MAAPRNFRAGSSPRTPVGQAIQLGVGTRGIRTGAGRPAARAHTRWRGRRQVGSPIVWQPVIELRGRVHAVPAPIAMPGLIDIDEGPQERWSAVQDLWIRMSQTFSVKVEREGDQVRLMFDLMSALPSLPDPGLLLAALDPQSYAWCQGPAKGTFVAHFEIEDDDLVFWLTPQPLVERWPGGGDLAWQLQTLMVRLGGARAWMD